MYVWWLHPIIKQVITCHQCTTSCHILQSISIPGACVSCVYWPVDSSTSFKCLLHVSLQQLKHALGPDKPGLPGNGRVSRCRRAAGHSLSDRGCDCGRWALKLHRNKFPFGVNVRLKYSLRWTTGQMILIFCPHFLFTICDNVCCRVNKTNFIDPMQENWSVPPQKKWFILQLPQLDFVTS